MIATFVTPDPGLDVAQVRDEGRGAGAEVQGAEHPVRLPPEGAQPADGQLLHARARSWTGRCLYPFLHARVSFSGKVFFCPFIRVEVGDLTESSLEEVWNGERYVDMRQRLLEHGIFPVCRRCCKVELSPVPAVATADIPRRRAIPVTVVHT